MSTNQKSTTLTKQSLFTDSSYSFTSDALRSKIERKYVELLTSLRTKLWKNEILHTVVHLLMVFQAIVQTLPWDIHFGTYIQQVLYYIHIPRIFGLHIFGYEANVGTLIAVACLQAILIMILLCIPILQSNGYFKIVKSLKKIGYILVSVIWLVALAAIYIYTGAAQCNFETGKLHRYEDMECNSTINILELVAGVVVVFNELFFGAIAILIFQDSNPKGTFFATHQPFEIVYFWLTSCHTEFVTGLIPPNLFIIRPLFRMIFDIPFVYYLWKNCPFFRPWANAIYSGVFGSTFCASLISFIRLCVNDNREFVGYLFGGLAIGGAIIGFIIGASLMHIYFCLVQKRLKRNTVVLNSQMFDVSVRLYHQQVKYNAFEIEEDISENPKVLVSYATVFMQGDINSLQYATLLLKKAMKSSPGLLTRYLIMMRMNEIEKLMNDKQVLIQKQLDKITRNKDRILKDTQQFWKTLLEENVTVLQLYKIIPSIYENVSQCMKLFQELMYNYPKTPSIIRSFASFIEEIFFDEEQASLLFDEADEVENEIAKKNKKKRLRVEGVTQYVKEKENISYQLEEYPKDSETSSVIKQRDYNREQLHCSSVEDLCELDLQSHKAISEAKSKNEQSKYKKAIMFRDKYTCSKITIFSFAIIGLIVLITTLIVARSEMYRDMERLDFACVSPSYTYRSLRSIRRYQSIYNQGATNSTLEEEYNHLKNNLAEIAGEIDEFTKKAIEKKSVYKSDSEIIWTERMYPIVFYQKPNHTVAVNYTLLEISTLLHKSLKEISQMPINQTSIPIVFNLLWLNRDSISNYFYKVCEIQAAESVEISNSSRNNLIIVSSCLLGGHIVLLLVFYVPIFLYITRERNKLLRLFLYIPKEIVGAIYQSLKRKINDDTYTKPQTTQNESRKLFTWFYLLAFVEFISVSALIGISLYTVMSFEGGNTIIQRSGETRTEISKIHFLINEYFRFENSEAIKNELKKQIYTANEKAKDYWNSISTGANTYTKISIAGFHQTIDSIVFERELCNETTISCKGLNLLMEDLTVDIQFILESYPDLSKEEIQSYLDKIHELTTEISNKIYYIMSIFTPLTSSNSEGTIGMYIIFGVASVIIILFSLPLYERLEGLEFEIFVVKQLLHYIPINNIESIQVIVDYLLSRKTVKSRLKSSKLDAGAQGILNEASIGVIICSDKGIIKNINKCATRLWGYDSSECLGRSLAFLFTEEEEENINNKLQEMQSHSQGYEVECVALSKKMKTFPVLLHLSHGYLGKQKIINIFVHDMTNEKKQNELLKLEKMKSEGLLLNIMPQKVAAKLKNNEEFINEYFEDVTCLFSDIVGFTPMASKMTSHEVVKLLNELVEAFDAKTEEYNLEKIKTIGDAYFVVGGLFDDSNDHPERIILFALDMLNIVKEFNEKNNKNIQLRIGVHTGPVIAGVIGKKKYAFDLWGDTVNVAARMESTGIAGKVQCSRTTYERVFDAFEFEERQDVDVKGKGSMTTYIVKEKKKLN